MNTKKNKYERLQQQIQEQKDWIAEHGSTLEGYIKNYGDPGIPTTHTTATAAQLWKADTDKLQGLENELQYYEYKQDMDIKNETRQEIVLHGIRWANNILVELLANHAASVSKEGRTALSETVSKLAEAEQHFRKI